MSSVIYRLVDGCHLDVEMTAVTDKPSIVNISNHVYFNLSGHGSGWEGLKEHQLSVDAANYTPDDEEYLPTGDIKPVADTEYDFLTSKSLGDCVPSARAGVGYCVNYCVGDDDKLFR